jgi:hypothetical protein
MKLMRMILKISLSKKGENEVYNTTGITEEFPGGIMEFYKFVGNFKTQEPNLKRKIYITFIKRR